MEKITQTAGRNQLGGFSLHNFNAVALCLCR